MTSGFTKVFQILATILQVGNALNVASLPVKWQPIVTGILTVAQAVQGTMAHYYTPDGKAIK